MSPALQLLENLALVGGGGVVTVLAQSFADRRKTREAKQELERERVRTAIEELRREVRETKDATSELRGFITGRETN